jgi:Trans-aconitate methyltransferase
MSDWNPGKYLDFKNERTLPSIDLVEKIDIKDPKNIIDIGCGPGNSTQVLVKKYPDSVITGLDSSETMIEKARNDYPKQTWILEKAENISNDTKYSIVFSNAALQWMDNHETLIPNLWNLVDKNGAFAAQIPCFEMMPACAAINDTAKKSKWNNSIKFRKWDRNMNDLNYYYELLSKYTEKIHLWETHYFHIMPSMQEIINFVHTTAFKPYLDQLNTEDEKQAFEKEVLEECHKYYKVQSNGKVLFPFMRMFMIAYKV